MVKQKTPDDVQTNIGYKKPYTTWLGQPNTDYGFYAERGGTIVSDFYPSIFDAVYAYPLAVIGIEAMSQLSNEEKRALADLGKPPITNTQPKRPEAIISSDALES